ncbi:MAG: hypothetical protein JXK07_09940 [Spirochaetes bacterium]|nr:hypothetical protein [Spirochaetota bacterium]MBN2771282.1 hypothetical protein [Spirochaetota bacterium]
MSLHHNFTFSQVIWKNVRRTLKHTDSGWHRFLQVILKILFIDLIRYCEYFYNQIFYYSCDYNSLVEKAKVYGIVPYQGESHDDFYNRLQLRRNLKRYDFSANLVRAIIRMNIDYYAEVYRAFCKDIFTIGVTPLGVGVSSSPSYSNFVWEVYLPDLSADSTVTIYVKTQIRKQLDMLFPSLEIRIRERRPGRLYEWEV